MRAADRDYVGRRSGIDADAYTGITAGGEVDDSWLREVGVPVYLLGNFRVSPTHTDDTASSVGHQICGELDRCPGRVGVDLLGFDQENLRVWRHGVGPLDIQCLLDQPLPIDGRLRGAGPSHREVGIWYAKVSGEGVQIGCRGRVITRIDDANRAPAACGNIFAGGDWATRGSGHQLVDTGQGPWRLIARRGAV